MEELELKDLINIGFHYKNEKLEEINDINDFLEAKDSFIEINISTDILGITDEQKKTMVKNKITDDGKKWFFIFFNNFNTIDDSNFNKEIEEYKEKIKIEDYDMYYIKFFKLLFYLEKNKSDAKYKNINESKVIELIRKKNDYNNFKINKYIYNANFPLFFKNSTLYENVVNLDINDKFYEYFENDDNFDIYFTYTDLLQCKFDLINKILDKLQFKKFEKIIYINEDLYEHKLDENPFRKLNYYDNNINKVIKYYNTFKFNLYESVDSWLKTQQISKKFNNQPKLKEFLKMIISFINIKNILIYLNDDLFDEHKLKIMLKLFNPNNLLIIDNNERYWDNKIEIFKETINKINNYINCELNNENNLLEEKKLKKKLNDFNKYFLPELLKSNNNMDLNLLMYFINNPKNNENIISSLINKYKNIL